MFRCFLRPRKKASGSAGWLPLLAGSGSRGIKLSKFGPVPVDRHLDSQIPKSVMYFAPFTAQGREQLVRLRSHGIGIYTEMKAVGHLDWKGIQVKTAPRHVVHAHDLRYFTEVGHAFAESIIRRLVADHEKPLWAVTSPRGDGNRPIVRGKAKYRLNVALRQALRNAGYDMDGRRLSAEDLQKQADFLGRPVVREPARRDIAELFGTFEVLARDSKIVHQIPFADLRRHCERIVRHLEEELGKTPHGRSVDVHSNARPRPQHQPQQRRPPRGGNQGKFNEKSGPGEQKRQRNPRPRDGSDRRRT